MGTDTENAALIDRVIAREGGDRFAQSGLRLMPERAEVPVIVRAERAKRVGKAVNLVQRETIFRPRAEDDAAAGGPEIDGGGIDR